MTILEVSKRYGLSADTLRYYERIGLLPHVSRGKSGNRDYSEADCGWVEFIKCMRGAGIQVEALITYVALFQQGDNTIEARKQILLEQRGQLAARIAEMQETLSRLDVKIEHYDRGLLAVEQNLRQAQERPGPMEARQYG